MIIDMICANQNAFGDICERDTWWIITQKNALSYTGLSKQVVQTSGHMGTDVTFYTA